MENFKLSVNYGVYYDMQGMEALEFLKEYNLKDNKFFKNRTLELLFNVNEVEASPLLKYLFQSKTKVEIGSSYNAGIFNDCVDIVKLYSTKSCTTENTLKENAKEEFFATLNSCIEKGVVSKKTKDDKAIISIDKGILTDSIFFDIYGKKLYNRIKDYKLEDGTDCAMCDLENGKCTVSSNDTENIEYFNKVIQETNDLLLKYITNIDKMKKVWKKEEEKQRLLLEPTYENFTREDNRGYSIRCSSLKEDFNLLYTLKKQGVYNGDLTVVQTYPVTYGYVDNKISCMTGEVAKMFQAIDCAKLNWIEEPHSSILKDFNGHEWVRFYEDEQGQPNVQWKEGCHNVGLEAFEGFEERVEDKYGDKKEESIYRTYMLESDKLRLAMNLPARTVGLGGTVINVCNFKDLISKRDKEISDWMQSFASHDDGSDYFVPKNMMWLLQAVVAEAADFRYLYGGAKDDDNYYYDLITLDYIDTVFAMPVPVLAKILKVKEKDIWDCFDKHESKDNVDFI